MVLLPPSETKRAGGDGAPLELARLALPQLEPQRRQVVDALVALSADEDAAARVLKLSPRQRVQIADNAALYAAPTMPAVDRYTGVLFDGLDAATLSASQRGWLGAHVMIHSAPLGPIGALDPVPAYRLGATATLPQLAPPRRHWADAVTAALAHAAPEFVLDLRSEAYAALGPVPLGIRSAYLRVVTTDGTGVRRALNHFNKHAKGVLVRALAQSRPRLRGVEAFTRWAVGAGFDVRPGAAGEVDLVV